MGHRVALLLGLCLVTSQSGADETVQEAWNWMNRMNPKGRMPTTNSSASALTLIHGLEQRLLNATFDTNHLFLPSESIQALAFNLNCGFAGLALSSDDLSIKPPSSDYYREQPQQARTKVRHAMQFPKELTQKACKLRRPSRLRLICIYFSTNRFFQSEDNSLLLHNYVLGAQLDNESVKDLREPINISFWHNGSLEGYVMTCVFWKEGASKRYWGAWSREGCRTEHPSNSQVLCRCNHLTYFAVLMQLSQDPLPAELLAPLTYISLVGCSISIVASLLTVLLYFLTRKKGDSLTCVHMNLHASVLLLNVTFLLSPTLAVPSVPGAACVALAATLHYALLSCLTWMAIEGFNLYLLLVRVYNIYIRRYVLKLCAVGWGVPAFLVLLLLAIKSSVYGRHTILLSGNQGGSRNVTGSQNTSICWVQSPGVHRALVIGYGGLTSLFNLVVLVWALRVLRRMKAQEKAPGTRACKDTVTVLGLTMLLGTTWTLAFFSFGVFLLPQLFLFTIFNSLYGFFLFLWFCFQRCRSEAEAAAEAEMEAFSSSQMTQ